MKDRIKYALIERYGSEENIPPGVEDLVDRAHEFAVSMRGPSPSVETVCTILFLLHELGRIDLSRPKTPQEVRDEEDAAIDAAVAAPPPDPAPRKRVRPPKNG